MVRVRSLSTSALVAALSVPLLAHAGVPTVRVDEVLNPGAGGTFTVACVGRVQGKGTFLKSNVSISGRGTRYANFEADILAHALAARLGVLAPRAQVVRLHRDSLLHDSLGETVLAMEMVESPFAGGQVLHGRWPGVATAALDEFVDMFLLDALIGNADRRGANYFLTLRHGLDPEDPEEGSLRPVAIDNNAGLGTAVLWEYPTNHMNFLPTFDGVGDTDVLRDLGSLRAIVYDAPGYARMLEAPEVRGRLISRARRAVARWDDAFLDACLATLPPEILPPGTSVDMPAIRERLAGKLPEAELRVLYPADRPLAGRALFEYRLRELGSTLRWRRDHLVDAVERLLASGKIPSIWD
jgi:hypothetical protein